MPHSLVLSIDVEVDPADVLQDETHLIKDAGHFVYLEFGVPGESWIEDGYQLA
jgi:hypothetical protein